MTEQATVTIKGLPQDLRELSEQIIFLKRLVDYQKEELEFLNKKLFHMNEEHIKQKDLLFKAAERLKARPKKEETWAQQVLK